MTVPAFEVSTLGRVAVRQAGGEHTRIAAFRKPLALLVLLAAERSVSRERALGLLWPDIPDENARHSLSQALVLLKRQLPGEWLDSGRDALAVSDEVWCDVVAFERTVAGGRLEEAVKLYGGAFLAGFDARVAAFEQWAGRRAAQAALRLRDALRQLIATSVAAAQNEAALQWARHWVAVASHEDEAQHRLIELLAATGRRTEALEQYELYRAALQLDELTPLDETLALVERIRRGEALGPMTTMLRAGDARAAALRTRRLGSRTTDGPRLVRIADGGVEAESYFLDAGLTRIGRSDGDITFPFDTLLAEDHASIEVTQGPAVPRMVLRPHAGEVYLRIRDAWPLAPGDRFRIGQHRFRFELTTAPPGDVGDAAP